MLSRGFILLCAIVFVVGLVTGPVQMLFPVYAESVLEETALFAALLRALPIGLGGISALIGGTLCDRFGRKPTILIGMTGAVVVGALFTTETPLFIWGILCYEGIASGFKTAGGQTYLISVVPSNRLGLATGFVFYQHDCWECQLGVPLQAKSSTVLTIVFLESVRSFYPVCYSWEHASFYRG